MRYVLILLIIIFYGCQSNSKKAEIQKIKREQIQIEKPKTKKIITWETQKFKDFEFTIPSNLILEKNLSDRNKVVYTNEKIGLTIDVAEIPNGSYNYGLKQVITNINLFGHNVKEKNKRNFSDFQIQNTVYDRLGNIEAVLVNQKSTLISGNNTEMKVKSYFAICYPYYITVTLSNPLSNEKLNRVTEKIKKSFQFLNFNKNREYNNEFLSDSKKWIIEKLNENVEYDYWFLEGNDDIKSTSCGTRFSRFYFSDNFLCMDYKKIWTEYADGTEYITFNYNSTVKIPIEDISDIYYEDGSLEENECVLVIETDKNTIVWQNLSKNMDNVMSNDFRFHIKCQEDNFISKLKSEIKKSI